MGWFVRIVGGAGIFVGAFFLTLFALDYSRPIPTGPDAMRAASAKSLMAALDKYRSTKGSYPVLPAPDSPVAELAKPLVGGQILAAMPPGLQGSRYASFDGKSYGMLLPFERGTCLIE